MKQKRNIVAVIKIVLFVLFVIPFVTACNSGTTNNSTTNTTPDDNKTNQGTTTNNTAPVETPAESGYPGASVSESGYPGTAAVAANIDGYPGVAVPDNIVPEPPNPERDIPAPAENTGSIGGVLIREISGAGFSPVVPKALYLGQILKDSEGRQALIAQGDDSPSAQLFPTGVFLFNNITPGTYALVIDIGVSQFPVTGEDGSQLLIDVEPGKALDLGQIIVELPGS